MLKRELTIIVAVTLLLTGCWSKIELNELAIVSAIGIDKAENGFNVSLQVINPSQIASQTRTSETTVTTYSTTGETINVALRKLTKQIPNEIYLSHVRVVIFGEQLAREGLRKAIDYLSRNHQLRTDFYLIVAKNSEAKALLKVLTSLERIPGNSIYTSLQRSETEWAPTKGINLDELLSTLLSKGRQPILTGVYIDGDEEAGNSLQNVEEIEPSAIIKIDRLGAFHGDRLIGWLNEDESIGYNYILGNVKRTVGTIDCNDKEEGRVVFETYRTKPSIKGNIKHGKPTVNISLDIEANIGEVECDIDITDPKTINELEKKVEKLIKRLIEQSIANAQEELQSDIFGFGNAINRSHPKKWNKLKHNWSEHFPEVQAKIDVKANIRRLGTTSDSFQVESEDE